MARPGVSYLDIAKAATQLTAQNTHPTIDAVRRLLGTGSSSTINRHLRLWRENQGNELEAKRGLPDSLLVAVKGVYDAIHDDANHKVHALKADADKQISDSKLQIDAIMSDRDKLAQQHDMLASKLTESDKQVISLNSMIGQLNKELEQQKNKMEFMQLSASDKKDEIVRLSQQLEHMQKNLAHYRESVCQERKKEKQEYVARLNGFEQQIHQYQAQLLESEKLNAVMANQLKQFESAATVYENKLDTAVQKNSDYRKELHCSKVTFDHLNDKYKESQHQYSTLNEHLKSDQQKIQALYIELEKFRERSIGSEQALNKSEDKLSELNNKYLYLLQEKTNLTAYIKQVEEAIR